MKFIIYSHSELDSESYYLIWNWEENPKQVQVDILKDKKIGKFFHSTMKDVKKMKGR